MTDALDSQPPFDSGLLDRLMEDAGLDALVATSGHNTRYLMGGYRFFFFAAMEALGHSRYPPVVVYVRGAPDRAAYVGSAMEDWERAHRPFWTPTGPMVSWTSIDAAEHAVAHLRRVGVDGGRIGIEPGFLPADAHAVLAAGLGAERLGDATGTLERLRAPDRGLHQLRRPRHGAGQPRGAVPDEQPHARGRRRPRPLEAGMVLSVETTMSHPRRGFIKLEDSVAVTPDGHELFCARHRGWNRGGLLGP